MSVRNFRFISFVPPPMEFPLPMAVGKNGDIYIATAQRGLLKFEIKE